MGSVFITGLVTAAMSAQPDAHLEPLSHFDPPNSLHVPCPSFVEHSVLCLPGDVIGVEPSIKIKAMDANFLRKMGIQGPECDWVGSIYVRPDFDRKVFYELASAMGADLHTTPVEEQYNRVYDCRSGEPIHETINHDEGFERSQRRIEFRY